MMKKGEGSSGFTRASSAHSAETPNGEDNFLFSSQDGTSKANSLGDRTTLNNRVSVSNFTNFNEESKDYGAPEAN